MKRFNNYKTTPGGNQSSTISGATSLSDSGATRLKRIMMKQGKGVLWPTQNKQKHIVLVHLTLIHS